MGLELSDIDNVLDYLSSVAVLHDIVFLWRPFLPDPENDLVLDIAVAAHCDTIVMYNKGDFVGAESFGLQVETAAEFLRRIGEAP